jgi:hypothetical protein
MFDKNFKKTCIRCYNELNKYSIKGQEKKDFITNIFNIHINSLYNWLNENNYINDNDNDNDINYDLNNNYINDSKITIPIEKYIIQMYKDKNKKFKIIKKKIKEKFNISLSYKDVLFVFKKNNLLTKKDLSNLTIEEYIIENIQKKCTLTASELVVMIFNKFLKKRRRKRLKYPYG